MERLNLRKLSELEVRKQYQIKISNRLTALEILSDGEDINRTWEIAKKKISEPQLKRLGLHELKQHNPWFD